MTLSAVVDCGGVLMHDGMDEVGKGILDREVVVNEICNGCMSHQWCTSNESQVVLTFNGEESRSGSDNIHSHLESMQECMRE